MKFQGIYLVLPFILLTACESTKNTALTVPRVAVKVSPAELTDITVSKSFAGTLEGARQAKIYAMIPERVVDIPLSEGSRVEKGQPVILLDKLGVNSRYHQAQAIYQQAKDNYEKISRLFEQKAVSEQDFKSARTAFEVAQADFNAARESVELTSPIDGVITDIVVKLGEHAPLGLPLATIASTSKMRMTIYVNSADIVKIKQGQSAKVTVDGDNPVEARVVEKAQSADPETRLFRVEIEMDNPDGRLKPGMFARCQLVLDNLNGVLAVKNSALFSEEGIAKVYVVARDTAFARSIEIGPTDGLKTQVTAGLEPGEQVVVVGKGNLRDRTPVIVSTEEPVDVSR